MSEYKKHKAKANTILRLNFIAEKVCNYIATEARDPAGRMAQDIEEILADAGCPEASQEEIAFILNEYALYTEYSLQSAKQAVENRVNGG